MRTRMLLAALLLAACALEVGAQDELLQQVNSIKKDQRYVWGEAMDENEETAFTAALQVMKGKLESRLNATVDDQEVLSKAKRIVRPMENLKRVMAYIEVDAVKTSTASDVKDETSAKPSIVVNLPSGSTATNTPPKETKSAPEEPVTMAPREEKRPAAPTTTTSRSLNATLNTIITDLMATEHLQGAITILDRNKKAGTLKQYAPYAKTANPESMYVLIIDAEYNIPLTVLSPQKSNGKRDNLTADKEETIDDYKDKLAVCFSLEP